jgi:hypothetical protein
MLFAKKNGVNPGPAHSNGCTHDARRRPMPCSLPSASPAQALWRQARPRQQQAVFVSFSQWDHVRIRQSKTILTRSSEESVVWRQVISDKFGQSNCVILRDSCIGGQ